VLGYDSLVSRRDESGIDERLRRIEAVTDTALSRLDVQDLLLELLTRVKELLDVDTAAVLLLDRSTQELVSTAALGFEEDVHRGFRLPVGAGFAGRVAAERRPIQVEHVADVQIVSPILQRMGLESLLGVPLLVGGELMGVLHVGTLTTRRFSEDDVRLLLMVADRIALATRARMTGIDRAAAVALQRSLLPGRLPRLPGLEMAARYVPGHEAGLGGDWYDVFTLPSGWHGVVVGDVAGRGLHAAVVMGRLRSALRAYALECDNPAEVLARLDGKAQHFEPGMMATALYAMIEPSCERMHISVAGHPAPALAAGSPPAVILDLPPDLPLGTGVTWPRRTTVVDLPAGGVLLFYTDGLIERRGQTLNAGLRLLCETVVPGSPDDICGDVMAKLIGTESPPDDVAVLAVRRT
jgi:putative methionine-R-sulfoxide reductase with GAF domain